MDILQITPAVQEEEQGEDKINQNLGNTSGSPEENLQGETAVKKDEGAPVTIALQGPLGAMYTDVLNKVLAQESYVGQLSSLSSTLEESLEGDRYGHLKDAEVGQSDDNSFGKILNVFCFDQLTDMDEVIRINEHVTKHKTQDYVLAVESVKDDHMLRSLMRMEKDGMFKVCMTKSSVVAAVKSHIQASRKK